MFKDDFFETPAEAGLSDLERGLPLRVYLIIWKFYLSSFGIYGICYYVYKET